MGTRALAAVGVCAVLAFMRAWVGHRMGARLAPDTALYLQGGVGLFPSPLGRAVGAMGAGTYGLVNAVASGALPVLAAVLARRYGGREVRAAVLALVLPVGVWTFFQGVDALGAALALGAVLARSALGGVALWLAAVGAHLAVAPIALAELAFVRRRVWAAAVVAAVCVAGAVWTPYGGNLAGVLDVRRAAAVAIVTGLLLAAPLAPWALRLGRSAERRRLAGWSVATLLAAGIVGAGERASNTRYGLPVSMLAAALAVVPASGGPRERP